MTWTTPTECLAYVTATSLFVEQKAALGVQPQFLLASDPPSPLQVPHPADVLLQPSPVRVSSWLISFSNAHCDRKVHFTSRGRIESWLTRPESLTDHRYLLRVGPQDSSYRCRNNTLFHPSPLRAYDNTQLNPGLSIGTASWGLPEVERLR